MDTNTIARAADLAPHHFHMWAKRGLIPSYKPDRKNCGRLRTFDEATAVWIVIMADLMKLKIGPAESSRIAARELTWLKIGSVTVTIDRQDVARRLHEAAAPDAQ